MSQKKKPTSADRAPRVDLRLPFVICAVEATVLMAVAALASLMSFDYAGELALILLGLYVVSAAFVLISFALNYRRLKEAEKMADQVGADVYRMFRTAVDLPYAIVNSEGHVRIVNTALQNILHLKSPVCDIPLESLAAELTLEEISVSAHQRIPAMDADAPSVIAQDITADETDPRTGVVRLCDDRRYRVQSYLFNRPQGQYYFLVFRDVNDHLDLMDQVDRDHVVIAYIMLDNLQELTQFVRANYRETVNLIEASLSEWITGMNGMIREYDRNKYIAVFSAEMLERCTEENFPILDKIMQIRVGDNSFPVSISMGIAAIDGTMAERERAANAALEMALQRGGNQVALQKRGSTALSYYGGAHKILEANTSISSRVSAHLLERRLSTCDHVLIMVHKNPDFDAIGSAVGAYRLARSILERHDRADVPVHIIMNTHNETFAICREHLAPLSEYEQVFIDGATARQTVTSETVLIITDVNNPIIFEAPEIIERLRTEDNITSVAIIDHHRLVGELPFAPFLHYIESTKSSASEIVAEILQQSGYGNTLSKEEANLLLAGIMLDTHNFTRAAGSQTFKVTSYLYSRNAHTDVAREFFNESIAELQIAGDFDAHTGIYADIFALSRLSDDHIPVPTDRVAASKAADKMLNIRGVEASFTFVLAGTGVAISARSKGRINVQLIMEKLEGGGHFDMAGAQISGNLEDAYEALIAAIDEYRIQFPDQCGTGASE